MQSLTRLIAFEHHSKPVVSRRAFFLRLAASFALGTSLIVVSLAAGMAGYHFLERLDWLDAFVNAAMILSGMGPLASPQTAGGKLFAGFYALYSGLVVIFVAGVIFAPVLHRFLHKFHVEEEGSPDAGERRANSAPKPGNRAGQRKPR